MMPIEPIDINNFHLIEKRLTDLYLSAFTKGAHAQLISRQEAVQTLKQLLEKGFGVVANISEEIGGFVMAHPLESDSEFPKEKIAELKFENSLYIAEVVVDERFRGQGIGVAMLNYIESSAKELHFKKLILRVWEKNEAALSLYKKTGFTEAGVTIFQTKYKDDRTPFEMQKIYLYKNLD